MISSRLEAMDAYVKVNTQKKIKKNTIHANEISLLRSYLDSGENVFICGMSGIGKTFIIEQVVDESESVEINHSMKFNDIKSYFKNSSQYLIIDGYKNDMINLKQVIDYVSDGNKITKKSLIVCSPQVHIIDNFKTIMVSKKIPEIIMLLNPTHPNSKRAAEMCGGNLFNFEHYLEFPDPKDLFVAPKEYVTHLLCDPDFKSHKDKNITEHGHMWDIIYENYVDSKGVNIEPVATSMSTADVFESCMYRGDWNVMPYFINSAMTLPKYYMGEPLSRDKLRPGSSWTKFGNYKMRYLKVRRILEKSRLKNVDDLLTIYNHIKLGDVEKYCSYNLNAQDFDVLNHLNVGNKLKARDVSNIKKKIKSYLSEN